MNVTSIVSNPRQSWSVRRIVVTAMLAAITVLLAFTPVGMIPMPAPLPSITLVHLPVILAAILEGPVVGMTIGFVFGISSLIRAIPSGALTLTFFFRYPWVSVLPRMIIPITVWLTYVLFSKLLKHKKLGDKIATSIAAVVGAMTNTVLCLGVIIVLYSQGITDIMSNVVGTTSENAGAWLVTVVGLPNGITEAVTAAILIPILKIAIDASTKRIRRGSRKPSGSKTE